MLTSKSLLFSLKTLGIAVLSLMLTIEYYNNVIFTSEQFDVEIYYFLRTVLWKYHLASGVILTLLYAVLMQYMNKKSKKISFVIVLIVATTGVVGMLFEIRSDYMHYAHLIVSIIFSISLLHIIASSKTRRII